MEKQVYNFEALTKIRKKEKKPQDKNDYGSDMHCGCSDCFIYFIIKSM